MRGKIIVVEGTDCSGKETQTSLLVQRLKKEGRKIERFSFPAYDTPTGQIVGGPYLGRTGMGESVFPEGPVEVDPKVASLYYAADRRYNMKRIIEEYLENGYDVVLDRYVESNMGHQGGKLFDKEDRLKLYKALEDLEYGFLELPRPDVIIFLYVPYKKAAELMKGRTIKDGVENSPLHMRNAEHAYLELCELHDYKKVVCVDSKNK